MADSSDEYFYNHMLYSSSSDESSDDDTDDLIATLLFNEHLARQQLMFRGSYLAVHQCWIVTEKEAMSNSSRITSIAKIELIRPKLSVVASVWRDMCSIASDRSDEP